MSVARRVGGTGDSSPGEDGQFMYPNSDADMAIYLPMIGHTEAWTAWPA